VLTPIEFAEEHPKELGNQLPVVLHSLHQGEPLGVALVRAGVSEEVRKQLLGKFVDEGLSDTLDQHYQDIAQDNKVDLQWAIERIQQVLESARKQRVRAQIIGGFSFVPFVGMLIAHGVNHHVPLFYASFAGFAVAFLGIIAIPKMRDLALREARLEYREYLFLFPLFFSITLLQKSGFFSQISALLHSGIEALGTSHIAYIQFLGAAFLSAILDNNVVADFTSRALQGLDMGVLYLFSMSQIAGYAVGGCWTHIGCAQSVVAYSFLQKEVDEHYTPFQWIKAMTPIILELFLLMTLFIYGEGFLLRLIP
ncbi:MAG: hypothetical protein HY610_04295, partial [Elusimicrobia bacterium]|nr:hypothetical protein [Elusimicrobiota bacterium]